MISCELLAVGPSRIVKIALLCSGLRLFCLRSAAGDVGASVTAGATRGANGLLDRRAGAAVKIRSEGRGEEKK